LEKKKKKKKKSLPRVRLRNNVSLPLAAPLYQWPRSGRERQSQHISHIRSGILVPANGCAVLRGENLKTIGGNGIKGKGSERTRQLVHRIVIS